MKKLYFEDVQLRGANNSIIISTVELATENQINDCRKLYELGNCPHTIVYDEPGWLYDCRLCGVCGAGLGSI